MRRAYPIILAVVLALTASLVLAACGGDDDPQDREFSIRISGSQPTDGVETMEVKQGDAVTIKLTSAVEAEVHLHGYDFEVEIDPGGEQVITLTADVTGRFLIEEEKTEAVLGYLEVAPR